MAENKMCFPETWEEFRKQYRIVDTEKVYTNGIEMIPTFRVKQWLEHMESEQNKMERIAKMFGKKLDEEFKLEITFFYMRKIFTVKFTKNGLECLTKYNAWEQRNCYIPSLLTGKAVVVND